MLTALFLAERAAPPAARRALARLEPRMARDTFYDLQLLVSELVTNSVEHSGAGQGDLIELVVFARNGGVRVEVRDRGSGFVPRSGPASEWHDESGRGLLVVDSLAKRWGVSAEDGTSVWFEMDAPGLVPA